MTATQALPLSSLLMSWVRDIKVSVGRWEKQGRESTCRWAKLRNIVLNLSQVGKNWRGYKLVAAWPKGAVESSAGIPNFVSRLGRIGTGCYAKWQKTSQHEGVLCMSLFAKATAEDFSALLLRLMLVLMIVASKVPAVMLMTRRMRIRMRMLRMMVKKEMKMSISELGY